MVRKIMFILECVIGMVIGVLILLNFVPIKFASTKQAVTQNHINEKEVYMCGFTATTYGNLAASPSENLSLSESKVFVATDGNDPFQLLSSKFTTDYLEPTGNRFIFVGKSEVGEFFGLPEATMLHIEKWDIVYPIHRKSWRAFVTPRSYLNIYDYDWGKVVGYIFGKN